MPTLYAPGPTPVAVTPRGFVALEAGASAALLARIRSQLVDGRGLGGVIEALTGAYGASLTAIPAFAVALWEGDGVRVAVRGDFAFDLTAAAAEQVSGAGVTTWTERVIPDVQRIALATPQTDAAPAEFEIADGVVLAGSVAWAVPGTGDRHEARSTGGVAVAPAAAPAAPEDSPSVPTPATSEPVAPAPPVTAEPVAPATPATAAPAIAAAPVLPTATPAVPATPAAPPPAGRAVPVAPGVTLIDSGSVPSVADAETLLPFDSALHPASTDSAGADDAEPDDDAGFDAEVGATVLRPLDEPGPVRGGGGSAPGVPTAVIGDHDGATISLAQARALRAGASDEAAGEASALPSDSAPAPLAPPRPPAPGRVRLSTGQLVALDRTVVIGRRPRSTRVSGTDLPHLVAVDSPQQDISRSHVELRVEGESIVATDLRTTNGTTLLRPGADPVRLHPGEGTVVVPGDVLDLGDGVTVHIEAPS
ncbi:FHA domain-containing protein [Microbacterium atlanticum]|uniref:FHA domain-containing protein n=1 Tax=Microbacterium atlanticum TaxID=2782168 RepID=UPI0018895767|nr:FHA domain-containing protein [Microbacterium atlanticum]